MRKSSCDHQHQDMKRNQVDKENIASPRGNLEQMMYTVNATLGTRLGRNIIK